MFWNLNILLDFPQSLVCVSFNNIICINWKCASFKMPPVNLVCPYVGKQEIFCLCRREKKLFCVPVGAWLDFFLKVYFVYKHLAIKATCSRFAVNYAWEIAPIFIQFNGNTLSAWICCFRKGNNFSTESNSMSIESRRTVWWWEFGAQCRQDWIIARADKLIIYNM